MRATLSSTSSRIRRSVEGSVSAGPKSSSSWSSQAPASASRASSTNGDGGCSAPRSEVAAYASTSPARARVIATCSSRRISATCASRESGGSCSASSASGIGSAAWRRAPGIREDCSPTTNTCSNSRPRAACMLITVTVRVRPSADRRRLLLAQAGLRHRRDVAGELPRRGLRRAPHERRGHLPEAREVHEPLDDVRLRGEQLLAAQAEAVDQPVHEQVRTGRVERAEGAALQFQEGEDPLAGLGRDLRGFRRGGHRRDHVELAPARDLDDPGEVDRAQLDRRCAPSRARRRRRRADRSAGAARRARRAPRPARRRRSPPRRGTAPPAPRARPPAADSRRPRSARGSRSAAASRRAGR